MQGKGDVQFVLGQTRTKVKAEEFAGANKIRLVDDYDAVLADKDIDAVVLATPHSQHGDQVRRAAAAGKHVFVEKPFTLVASDAESAIAAMRKAGKVLSVGFNRRFHPNMEELKRRVKSGALGEIGTCIGEQTAYAGYALDTAPKVGWRLDPEEAPAGAMTGIGIHVLDSMIGLFGKVDEVHCIATRRGPTQVDNNTSIIVRFANGVTGMIYCCYTTAPNYRFAVYGAKGLAEITKPTLEEFRFVPAPDNSDAAKAGPETIQKPGHDMLAAELTAFAHAVRDGKQDTVPLDEVLYGVKAFEAVVKSSKSGSAVKVS